VLTQFDDVCNCITALTVSLLNDKYGLRALFFSAANLTFEINNVNSSLTCGMNAVNLVTATVTVTLTRLEISHMY
jgi:hypothetical protein